MQRKGVPHTVEIVIILDCIRTSPLLSVGTAGTAKGIASPIALWTCQLEPS